MGVLCGVWGNGKSSPWVTQGLTSDAKYTIRFDEKRGTIFNSNKEVVAIDSRVRHVYVLDMISSAQESCFFAKAFKNLNWLWHKRLARLRLNFKTINKPAKQNLVIGLPLLVYLKDKPCSSCEKGKHHRASFKTKQTSFIKKCLHLLHTDLFGPVTPGSINHEKYTLVIVDEYSRADIQFSTSLCARYQVNPKESYLIVVKRIFRYLKDTPSRGVWYPKCLGFDLKGYFTFGACQLLGGKLVCWSAKKHQYVAMSLAEAEYLAATGCCANILWMKSQLTEELKETYVSPPLQMLLGHNTYLTHVCGKTGGLDQISNNDATILYCLANGVKEDYEKINWEDLIHKLNKKTRENIIPYLRFLSLLLEHMRPEYENEELTINPTQEVSQGKNLGPKSRLKRKRSSKHTFESTTEASKSQTGQSKKETKSSSAKDKSLIHPLPPTPMVGEMHKEAQQAAGGPTSLGATREEVAHPQLSSRMSTFIIIKPVYSASFICTLSLHKGTKNYSFDHIFVGSNLSVLVDKTKSAIDGLKTAHIDSGANKESRADDISLKVKLEDLSDILKDTRFAFFIPDSSPDEPMRKRKLQKIKTLKPLLMIVSSYTNSSVFSSEKATDFGFLSKSIEQGQATASPTEGEKNTKDADTNLKDELVDLLGKNVVTQYYTKKLLFDKYCDKMLKRKRSPKITNREVITKKGPITLKIYREDGYDKFISNLKKLKRVVSLLEGLQGGKKVVLCQKE
nr:uncharacterized mitochondrial protein AtMg00810-like [Tanacetum cinerariifolium]